MKTFLTLIAATALPVVLPAAAVKTVRLPTPSGMTRAELRHTAPPTNAQGALVLCPGYNGDGATLFSREWIEFAASHRLTLIRLSFASDEADLAPAAGTGYYYVTKGSGETLREGLRRITGSADTPLVVFGFSGGAHFAHRFAYRYPNQVRVWCAYGFGWWDAPPQGTQVPPGVFVCGLDDERLPQTRDAFLAARRAKAPVCWLGVPQSGHAIAPHAAAWVRDYFHEELNARDAKLPEVWAEASDRGLDGFIVRVRLPSESCAASWRRFGETTTQNGAAARAATP